MKNILKITFLTCIIIPVNVFCQKGVHSIGIGPTTGIPVSNQNFSYYYKNGYGGILNVNFGISSLGRISTGIIHLSIGAEHPSVVQKTSLTLIDAGFKTNFLNSHFFVSIEAGLAEYGRFDFKKNYFVISGSAGYSFRISKGSFIDLSSSYKQIVNTPMNNMWLNANVIYRFNIGKKK